MDGILQERSPCWLGLFAGHEAHSAGACRALCVEADIRHCGQLGHLLAPALSADREQQQHNLTASAKAAPAQCSAHHCSICGAARHTHRRAHTRAHACARTHMHTNTRARIETGVHMHIHMHTHKHTRAHTYTRTNTQAHTRTNTHTHTHTHIHTRARIHTHTLKHAYARTRCMRDGLRQLFSVASDAPTLVSIYGLYTVYTYMYGLYNVNKHTYAEIPYTVLANRS